MQYFHTGIRSAVGIGLYKALFGLLLILSYTPLTFAVETAYISDEFRVPLRKTPCNRCAILHRGLKTGLKLKLIETAEGWSHVQTPSGITGWIESQYVTTTPIARNKIAYYKKQSDTLKKNNTTLNNLSKTLKDENDQLKNQLNTISTNNQTVSRELENIREVSSNALELKAQNQIILQDNKILQSKIDVLTALNKQLESDDFQKWFLYGAMTVFLGAILSILLPNMKRKNKSSSEWA